MKNGQDRALFPHQHRVNAECGLGALEKDAFKMLED